MKYIVPSAQRSAVDLLALENFLGTEPTDTFALASVNSGLMATAQQGLEPVVQTQWNGSRRQQWHFVPLTGPDIGFYKIVNAESGQVLDVRDWSREDGADIIIWPWHGGENQQWRFICLVGGIFVIQSRLSLKTLDVSGASQSEGTKIIQWGQHNGANQQWVLLEVSGDQLIRDYSQSDLTAMIYQHGHFGGLGQELGVGRYTMSQLTIGNDQLSSLRVPEGLVVTLYEHENFAGRSKSFVADAAWVGDDFNDITSSITVQTAATIYEHADYQGRGQKLIVGQYNMSRLTIGNDQLSSLRVPKGLKVTAYEHADFRGRSRSFTQDTPWVGDDFNDIVSAVAVQVNGLLVPDAAVRTSAMLADRNAEFVASNCGADACGGAACGAVACGAAVCGGYACGGAACAADSCGGAACGADACGGAVCGTVVCATDACGGVACAADACGALLGCGGAACAADAGGTGGCGVDACGANACAINACPADACAADACAIDVIPLIPGI
jgi:hypothetical protein